MVRIVRGEPEEVGQPTMAPHHFRWDSTAPEPTTYDEWKTMEPYKEGDVVWLQYGPGVVKRARVVKRFPERNAYDEIRTKYRVQVETSRRTWSRQWFYTYAGFIQRGYALAQATDAQDAERILGDSPVWTRHRSVRSESV